MKKIILTGGGTAGHVTPNLALVPSLKDAGFDIKYIGSYEGMEKTLVEDFGLDYEGISSGKLRRYKSLKNLTDPFRVIKGYFEAKNIIKAYKPDVVFSKGGFVTVPVVYAAASCKVPAVIHESDMTPGLANKLSVRKASVICYNFPETARYLGSNAVHTGQPIRTELFEGDRNVALKMCGFSGTKPVIMVTGGSLGAENLNNLVRDSLSSLLTTFDVAHLCGRGKVDNRINYEGYAQFEYINEEMKDFFAAADIVISRAGANSICEIAALKKPNILVPLSLNASRGDQILNAESFKNQGFSEVVDEDKTTGSELSELVRQVYNNRDSYISAMSKSSMGTAVTQITEILEHVAAKQHHN